MRIFNYLKQFAVIAVAALAFVACEPDTPETPAQKEWYLELTSGEVMEFSADGGTGEITWEEKMRDVMRSTPYEFTIDSEAEWITISYNAVSDCRADIAVDANNADAREAKIVITYRNYNEQVIEVTVKQAAAAASAEPVELAAAARIPSAELGLKNNIFVLTFVDDSENTELNIVLVGDEGDEILKAGTYSAENGGFSIEENLLVYYDVEKEYTFVDGEVVVAVDGDNYDFDMTFVTEDGEEFLFVYAGPVLDMEPEDVPAEPVAFTPASVKAELYETGNFFLQLYIDGTRYHELDMYDVVVPNNDYLSAGLYSYAAETIGSWSVFNTGNDQTCGLEDAELTLTHNADLTSTITGFIKSEEGDHITIDWTGVIEGMNLSTGGDEPENPTDGTYFNFVSANVCWMGSSGWRDFQIAFEDANGVVLTCNFYYCTEASYLPEATYSVTKDVYGCVYTDSYSYIDLNDGGALQDIHGGQIVVAEVDGQYSFTFENITYGVDLKSFSGVYVGQVGSTAEGVDAMVVPSEYEAPEISDEVTELTIYEWFESFSGEGEHELNFVYDTSAMRVVTIDFFANPITAGTYVLGDSLSETYCKYQSKNMSECTAVVTENSDGTLTFDVNFVVDYARYHFNYTAKIY